MYYQPTFGPHQQCFYELLEEDRREVLSNLAVPIGTGSLSQWPKIPLEGFPMYIHLACLMDRWSNEPLLVICPNWNDVTVLQASRRFTNAQEVDWYAMRDWNMK